MPFKSKEKTREYMREYHRKWQPIAYRTNALYREKVRIYNSLYYQRNLERLRKSHAGWARKFSVLHPDKKLSQQAAKKAKMKGCKTDSSAIKFYTWVRSQTFVPCSYCGVFIPGKEAHVDHIVAIAKGGAHIASNLCAACPRCNLSKGSMSAEDFLKKLKNKPM